MSDLRELLVTTSTRVADDSERVKKLAVFPAVDLSDLRAALWPLRDGPTAAATGIDELVRIVEPALVATTGPRYFEFVAVGLSTLRPAQTCSQRAESECLQRCDVTRGGDA